MKNRVTGSVASRAKKKKSANAQSKQIQTLGRQVAKLNLAARRNKQNLYTLANMNNINLARAFPTQTGDDLAKDKAWVMPVIYAPATPLPGIALPQNTTAANNSPTRDAVGAILQQNTINKSQIFGSDFDSTQALGVTHKGGTLKVRVVCTFKQSTSLHFFLVRPAKGIIADNLLRDVGYLDEVPVIASTFPLRGAGVALREEIDYSYGASAGSTPGIIDPAYRNMNPTVAFMNLKNWDIISKRVCRFDSGGANNLLTTPPAINTAADPNNNLVYKNLTFKIPGAGYLKRNMTTAEIQEGGFPSYGAVDQQNEKSIFLVCLRTLRNGGPAPSSNTSEYCTATITQMDKYSVTT